MAAFCKMALKSGGFMPQFLSPLEREALKIQHRSEHDKRVCDRIKAVLLFDEEWGHAEYSDLK